MSDITNSLLRLILIWGPILIGLYGIIAFFVAIRATLRARGEAYNRKHADFLRLKKRVQDKLREDSPDGE